MDIEISPEALKSIKNFKMPKNFIFGQTISPVMVCSDWKNNQWSPPKLLPYGPLQIMPTSKVLHYGQEIFEGMKAYYVNKKGPYLFRPKLNAQRFNFSAKRMAMPEIDTEIFLNSVKTITKYSKDFIPNESEQSLYIRPFMFASEENIGIKSSQTFKFLVVASPAGSYFNNESMSVYIERKHSRAFPGGTGQAKTGGNYAASLKSSLKSLEYNCIQTLWLDAVYKKTIEEMSGMNFFCVVNNELWTPKITDSILEGITRKSLIELAQHLKFKVIEKEIYIDNLLDLIQKGQCTEAFACGTAAIVTPIQAFYDPEQSQEIPLKFPNGSITSKLKKALLNIQEGSSETFSQWRFQIDGNN